MLAVLHERTRVGRLGAAGRELEFAYDAKWRARTGAFALSPRLPLREQPWHGEEVLFFFANLLPEGNLLDTLCKLRRLPRGNVLRLLEAFGRECAGAFEIVPEDEQGARAPKPDYAAYSNAALRKDLANLRANIPLLQAHGALRLSLAGAQNKIPVRYDGRKLWLPQHGAPSTHILKPALQPEAEYPDAVRNEAFCMRLAGALGMNVPATTVLTDPEPMLLIARYDRVVDGEKIRRLHQLDLCQLTGTLPDQKYESDGGPGFADLFAQVDAHSAAPALDRLALVDWLLCNFLIGNVDAHAKNVAMLYTNAGRLRLAPAYDLLALGHWSRLSTDMAMAIGGERRPEWVQARHWQRLCEAVGLNAAQLRRRALRLAATAESAHKELARDLELPQKLRRSIGATLRQRGDWIERRLAVQETP
ncbi:MAG: type II toxin-antitoxin system HipA family toxin [Proteobacteria bacterium]|nr:type II toxin-antitoxin system HipA family toxin [Pseudomonadota bacterium]